MKLNAFRTALLISVLALIGCALTSCGCEEGLLGDTTTAGSGNATGNDTMNAQGAICGDPKPLLEWPKDGYFLEFKDSHEFFRVLVSSTAGKASIQTWLGDPSPESLGVPGGPVESDDTFNPGYSYRLMPSLVAFKATGEGADAWPEDCDAAPCYVEEDLYHWLKSPGTWCPWAAVVQSVWDCTGGDGTACDKVFPSNSKLLNE